MAMDKFFGVVLSTAGRPISGASCRVTMTGTSTVVALFGDDEVTALPNPLTTDLRGGYAFCADDGAYDIAITYKGITTTVTKVTLRSQGNTMTLETTASSSGSVVTVGRAGSAADDTATLEL